MRLAGLPARHWATIPAVTIFRRFARPSLAARYAVALALSAMVAGTAATAQRASLPNGAGVVTGFSGWRADATGAQTIDLDGDSVAVYDLSAPGFAANGSRWDEAARVLGAKARDVGQVFGIAVDNRTPATIYVAASSAYGLLRTPDNRGWMPGMWGAGGGPGTIYRLNPARGYAPEVLVDLDLEGRPNSGAGIGNIAYDAVNRQLFASDLESGMIFRIDAETGDILEQYDHGVDGRAYFLDSQSGEYRVLDVAPFDRDSAPRIGDCGAGPAGEAARRFAAEPACWNLADFRRRIYGLGVHFDPEIGVPRLYYATWGAATFGHPAAETAQADAVNSIWSIGLDAGGGFDLQSVRRELELPVLFMGEMDVARFGVSHPVTDIVFSQTGVMIVAERGGLAGLNLGPGGSLVPTMPSGSRVLAFARADDGRWAPQGRYDIGYYERSELDPPHIRANAAGGVALGFGYTAAGRIDTDMPEGTVWMTGDDLCSPLAPCPPRAGGEADARPTTGAQGTPAPLMAELAPPSAYTDLPADGPATDPVGPDASYMLPVGQAAAPLSPGQIGDIEIVRSELGPVAAAAPPPAMVAVPLPVGEALDLAIAKTALDLCVPGGECVFSIEISNAGTVPFEGPIILSDVIGGGLALIAAEQDGFVCAQTGSVVTCYRGAVSLMPGQRLSLQLAFLVPGDITITRVRNCVSFAWPGVIGRDQIRAIQFELIARGFDPGVPDGIMGPNTSAAISAAEAAFGLPVTGQITDALLVALFGPDGARTFDAVTRNNRDCAWADIDVPPPPMHFVQLSAFHRRFISAAHDVRTSGPIDLHDPAVSAFHLRWRSSMHDGVTTRPIPFHFNPVSVFHRTWRSAQHNPATSLAWPLHAPALSTFHLTFGSGMHNPATSFGWPLHNPFLSAFHRTWRSSQHNPITTQAFPLHRSILSNFHRTWQSAQHNPATSLLWPIHNPLLTSFHRHTRSSLHNPATSLGLPHHNLGISNFHRTWRSSLHNLATSGPIIIHNPALSGFHRTHRSSQHNPATSGPIIIHNPALSGFHRTHRSAQHNPRTSGPLVIHNPALSSFHRTHRSAQHNPRTSGPTVLPPPGVQPPGHNIALSSFHRTHRSAQHNPRTSGPTTVSPPGVQPPSHNVALSSFHRTHRSAQHNPRTSGPTTVAPPGVQPPSHNVALSSFHRTHRSAQHNPRTSGPTTVAPPGVQPPRPPAHNPALSSFHRTHRSAQHNPATSGPTTVAPPGVQPPRVQPTPPPTRVQPTPPPTRVQPTPPPTRTQPPPTRVQPTPPPTRTQPPPTRVQPTPPPTRTQPPPTRVQPTPPPTRTQPPPTRVQPTPPPTRTQPPPARPAHSTGVSNFHRTNSSAQHNPATSGPRGGQTSPRGIQR